MKCPADSTVLQLAERQGIELDYCPTCRGVWLDRGELDKIIERAEPAPPPAYSRGEPDYRDRYDEDDDRYERVAHGDGRRKRKRGGFLGELFEFGG